MAYKRNYKFTYYNQGRNSYGKAKISIAWNNLIQAYDISFTPNGHWLDCETIITYIKMQIPSGDRDYNPQTKIWGVKEQHIKPFLIMLKAFPNKFDVSFTEKPSDIPPPSLNSKDITYYINSFKNICGVDPLSITFLNAKGYYRKFALLLHPDRSIDNEQAAMQMRDLNEAWMILKKDLYKEA